MAQLLGILRVYVTLGILSLLGATAAWVAFSFSWNSLPSEDNTMAPTLQGSQIFRVDKRVRRPDQLRHGDLVAYRKDDRIMVGRVAGLPGETLSIHKGALKVNGDTLQEFLSPEVTEGEVPEILIPRDHLYVLVDTRAEASYRLNPQEYDSRGLGPISCARLIGKLLR